MSGAVPGDVRNTTVQPLLVPFLMRKKVDSIQSVRAVPISLPQEELVSSLWQPKMVASVCEDTHGKGLPLVLLLIHVPDPLAEHLNPLISS